MTAVALAEAASPCPERRMRLLSSSRIVFRERGGRTYLAAAEMGAPLKALRPFDLGDGRVLLQVISAAPGIFGGDRYDLEISVESGATAVVITPSATKIHSMRAGECAEQSISLDVADGATLEFYPSLNIPLPEADFSQRVEARVSEGGSLALTDSWTTGRVARGERWVFRRISARTRVDRRDGLPLYRDALELRGGADAQGVFEGRDYACSGYWHGSPPDLGALPLDLETTIACGPIGDKGMYLRGLFDDGLQMQSALQLLEAQPAGCYTG